MKYLQRSFSVGGFERRYADNWAHSFRPPWWRRLWWLIKETLHIG